MRTSILVVCIFSMFVSGCATSDWTFQVSRSAYQNGFGGNIPIGSSGCPEADLVVASFFLAILLAPVVIDLVLLPITVPHDILTRSHGYPYSRPGPRNRPKKSPAPTSRPVIRKQVREGDSKRNRNGKIRARGFRASVAR